MSEFSVGFQPPRGVEASIVSIAEKTHKLGFDTIWIGELWGHDALVQIGMIASQFPDLQVGSAIVNVYSRTPATLAMAACTVNELSNREFNLGLGPSTKQAIESIHGKSFDRPLKHLEECAEIVEALTSGEESTVTYEGEYFQIHNIPPQSADVSIYNAALGPKNRKLTGRLCDGWIPHIIPFSELESAFETVLSSAHDHGRDREDLTVAPYVPVSTNEDPDKARKALRKHVAYYVGSGEGYRRAAAMAFPDQSKTIASLWKDGNQTEAVESVPDKMVDEIGIAGRPDEVRDRLRELLQMPIVDKLIIVLPIPIEEQWESTLETIRPDQL